MRREAKHEASICWGANALSYSGVVGSCSLWSEDSHILCVQHERIQAGLVDVVREIIEFI
jgi:hypothetical protein